MIVPSLGWDVDPEIFVDGAPLTNGALIARRDYAIVAGVTDQGVFHFDPSPPDPLPVNPGDTIAWTLTHGTQSGPEFSVRFSSANGSKNPLTDDVPLDSDSYDHQTSFLQARIFRARLAGENPHKPFTYMLRILTPTGIQESNPRTIQLG